MADDVVLFLIFTGYYYHITFKEELLKYKALID